MSIGHKRLRVVKGGRNRKPRLKTFKTQDAAHKYATAKGFKDFTLVNARIGLSSKISIVQAK